MNTVYLLTKIITYPGAFLKGFWEHVACRILKLEVTDRHYLNANAACGHAVHSPAMTPKKVFLLSFLPWLAQRILGWIFLGASVVPLLLFNMRDKDSNPMLILEYVALYLGLSIICNSFPQWEDAKRHWRLFYGGPTPEEEQTMLEYSDSLLAAVDAEAEPEAEIEPEPEEENVAEEDGEEDDDDDEDDEEEAPELPYPVFADRTAQIILAPCNAYFLAGAWLEKLGIPAILAAAITVAALVLR